MFLKIHLFSQDSPDGSDQFRFRAHPYLRMVGTMPKGPATFQWNQRQLDDLEELWINPDSEGARDRLAKDLATFAEKLGWVPDADKLEESEDCGEEVLVTVNSAAQEMYILPWEVIRIGASDCYLSDFSSALVRYAVPGLGVREVMDAPANPGVLFAWSAAGGAVPSDEQGQAIRESCAAAGASFKEVADVDEASLQAALDDNPPSVLHLLCHGMPGPEGEPPLLNWGPSDNARTVTATRLARMLRRAKKSIRLVVLSACGSGDSQQDVMFMSSLAQELHKKGIPNVVASRYPLSVRGSKVLVQTLYKKLLDQAWSLERALRHTREELFKADADGKSYSGDAYGMQLYAYDTEKFVSANGVEAERPVLATYVFGTAEQPTPASLPPRKDTEIEFEVDAAELKAGKDKLLARLREHAEDDSLTFEVMDSANGKKGVVPLKVETTVDGAQRLVASWRSGDLDDDTGYKVISMKVAKGLKAPMAVVTGGVQLAKALGASGVLLRKGSSAADKVAAESGKAGVKTKAGVMTGKSATATASKGLGIKLLVGTVVAGAAVAGGVVIMQNTGSSGPDSDQVALVQTFDAQPALLPIDAPSDASIDAPSDASIDAPIDAPEPEPAPAPANTVPRVRLNSKYDLKTTQLRFTLKVPSGVKGVLVVTSTEGPVKGNPEDGKEYAPGASWPHGSATVISVASKSTHMIPSKPGQTTYVATWAYNKDLMYGPKSRSKYEHVTKAP